jgi:hypothetical protein
MRMKRILLFPVVASIVIRSLVHCQSITHPQHVVDVGGGSSNGEGFTLCASIGQPTVEVMNRAGFVLESGYLSIIQGTVIVADVIRNGDFELGADPWALYAIGAGSFGLSSPGFQGKYAGSVSIPRTFSVVMLYQADLAFEPNAGYRLSFAAYSTTGHDMLVFVTTGREMPSFMDEDDAAQIPWILKMYGPKLSKSWQTFSAEFKTRGFTDTATDGRLTFLFTPFARPGDLYCIDNVVLQKVDGSSETTARMTEPLVEEAVAEENLLPTEFSLAQNYPNPFNPTTTIKYALAVASHVTLKVYNTLGQEVEALVDESQDAGFKSVIFDAGRLASGIYFYRIQAGNFVDTKKLLILK